MPDEREATLLGGSASAAAGDDDAAWRDDATISWNSGSERDGAGRAATAAPADADPATTGAQTSWAAGEQISAPCPETAAR
jgi:hypothetical protein